MRFKAAVFAVVAVFASCIVALAQTAPIIPNDGSTGTKLNYLAKDNGSGAAVVCSATTDIPIGVVVVNGSSVTPGAVATTGNATLAQIGYAPLYFAGSTTAGHYATFNSSCQGVDAGTSPVAPNIGVIGTTGSGAGVRKILLQPGIFASISTSGPVAITNATSSTSPTTGALTVAGGVGIEGQTNIGTAGGVGTVTDIRQYGGNGNGIADNLAAFNAFVAAAPSTGAQVYLPPGTYYSSAAIDTTGKSGLCFVGAGRNATVVLSTGNYAVFQDLSTSSGDNRTCIKHMHVKCGGKANANANGIVWRFVNNGEIADDLFTGCNKAMAFYGQYLTNVHDTLIDGAGGDQNNICIFMDTITGDSSNNSIVGNNISCNNMAQKGFDLLYFWGTQIVNSNAQCPTATSNCWQLGGTAAGGGPPQPQFGHFANDLSDGGLISWYVAVGTGATAINKLQLVNLWGSSAGLSGNTNTFYCDICSNVTVENFLSAGSANAVYFHNGANNRFTGVITGYNAANDGHYAFTFDGTTDSSANIDANTTTTVLGYNGLQEINGAVRNSVYGLGNASWTPGMAGSSTAGTFTPGTDAGNYEREGRRVHVDFNVSGSLSGAVGNLEMTGLPFGIANVSNINGACPLWYMSGWTPATNFQAPLTGRPETNTTKADFWEPAAVGHAGPSAAAAVGEFGSFQVAGSCTYTAP